MRLDLPEDRAAEYSALLSTLDEVLFLTANTNNTNYEDFLQTSRLVPSFYDRRPYFGLISKDKNSVPECEEVSYQLMARKLFTSRIREEVARFKVNHQVEICLASLCYLSIFVEPWQDPGEVPRDSSAAVRLVRNYIRRDSQ